MSLLFKSVVQHLFKYRPILGQSLVFRRSVGSDSSGYDGDGKTIVSIINEEERQRTLIDSYSKMGFRLNSGLFVLGPVAVFPQLVLQWDVVDVRDINIKSLSLFWLLEPKIDILVIGIGDSDHLPQMDMKTRLFLKNKNINVEVLPTPEAVASFNFMNVDYRNVAAALIPVKKNYVYNDQEAIESHKVKGNLYEAQNSFNEEIEKRFWKNDKKGSDAFEKYIADKTAEEHRNKKY